MIEAVPRDHGGAIDIASSRYGGRIEDWIDLSTGINPAPYPIGDLPAHLWTDLPRAAEEAALIAAARDFWQVDAALDILPAAGASVLIAQLPNLLARAGYSRVDLDHPSYNEWRASFTAAQWQITTSEADVIMRVHPNNPDGRLAPPPDPARGFYLFDESFCDICPEVSHLPHIAQGNGAVIKSFGKFWGLAGLRLGFLIAPKSLTAPMAQALGPWPVSGAALAIGTRALRDYAWAKATRARLAADAVRLDHMMTQAGAAVAGGCDLFRLYAVDDAAAWQDRLARHHIWTRIFPYSDTYLRLGLPYGAAAWARLQRGLA